MRIRIVHLLSRPETDREVRSADDVSRLSGLGFEYLPIVNAPWSGPIPEPRDCADRWFNLTAAHYGCWKAHRDAITEHLSDVDALLVCECDCVFSLPIDQVAQRITRAAAACVEGNLSAFTFGFRHNGQTIDRVGEDAIVLNQWIGTECYLVPIAARETFIEMFAKPFDAYDICLCHYLIDTDRRRIGTFADRPVAVQANGVSLITGGTNIYEEHFKHVRY